MFLCFVDSLQKKNCFCTLRIHLRKFDPFPLSWRLICESLALCTLRTHLRKFAFVHFVDSFAKICNFCTLQTHLRKFALLHFADYELRYWCVSIFCWINLDVLVSILIPSSDQMNEYKWKEIYKNVFNGKNNNNNISGAQFFLTPQSANLKKKRKSNKKGGGSNDSP